MTDQQVLRIERLAPQLGVEIGAAGLEAAAGQHLVIGERHLRHVVGELVGVPARLVVVAVHVDRTEDPERIGQRQLVLEGVAGKDRVALLDIDLHFLLQPVAPEKAVDGGDVVVVLVLGRLLRLRLDQDRALEADAVLVVDDHAEEASGLVHLAAEIGVEQRLVALAPAPQHIVLALQPLGDVDAMLHRRGRIGEHVRVGIGGGTRHEAAVREQVGRAPQQLDAGLLDLGFEDVGDLVEALGAFGEGRALRPDIGVVEAEIGDAEQREHLEGDVGLELRVLHRVAEPRTLESLAAERIAARPGEGVPIGDREAQVVLHPLARDHLVLVVEAIGERVGRLRSFIFDLA